MKKSKFKGIAKLLPKVLFIAFSLVVTIIHVPSVFVAPNETFEPFAGRLYMCMCVCVCLCVCLFPSTVEASLTETKRSGQRCCAEEITLCEVHSSPNHR